MQKTSKYLLRSLLYTVILHIAEFPTNIIFPKLHAQLEPHFRIMMTRKQKEIISPFFYSYANKSHSIVPMHTTQLPTCHPREVKCESHASFPSMMVLSVATSCTTLSP